MLRGLIRDESGMTMGLVVIMIVVIGVMGAGLLTFVSTDLNAVVEVNQGQKAFEMADAGAEAAKQQLATDSDPLRYDGTGAGSSESDLRWSFDFDRDGSPRETGVDGMTLDMDGNSATVTIQSSTSGSGLTNAGEFDPDRRERDTESTSASQEPVVNSFPGGSSTYTVVSTGRAGGATRKVEAVFQRGTEGSGYDGFPMGTFATGEVEFTGEGGGTGVTLLSWRELYQ